MIKGENAMRQQTARIVITALAWLTLLLAFIPEIAILLVSQFEVPRPLPVPSPFHRSSFGLAGSRGPLAASLGGGESAKLFLLFHVFLILIFLIVAYGLFRRRRWARWLTLLLSVVTAVLTSLFGLLFLQGLLYDAKEMMVGDSVFAIISFVAGLHVIMAHAFLWQRAVRAEFA